MEDLLERVVAIAEAFERAEIAHSFGGAIALGYYHTFRATHDIDVNVYLSSDEADRALEALHAVGVPRASSEARAQIERDAQTRLRWGRVPVDLFFSNLPFHEGCLARRRVGALLGREIQLLGPEDLIVCKVAFGREKDDRDVVALLDTMGERLDLGLCLHWIDDIVGPDADSARRFREALDERSLAVPTRVG